MPRTAHRLANLLIVFLAAAGFAAAGTFLYFQYSLRSTLEQAISERLGTATRVGFARISLFPRSLQLASIAIDNPEGFRDRYFLKTNTLNLEIERYARQSNLFTSPQMTINGLEVWIEHQGRRSNSNIIQGNIERFDRRHGVARGDKTRLIIRELRIRNIEAQLRAGSDSTTAEVPEIVLRNVGAGRGGVTVGELAGIVTRAVLRAVLRNEFRRELDQRKEEKTRELRRKLDELFD
jgi:hypothetical protein